MRIEELREGDLLVDPKQQDTVLVTHIKRGPVEWSITMLGDVKLVRTINFDRRKVLDRLNVIRDGELIWVDGMWVQ